MYKEIWFIVREYSGKYFSRMDGERMVNKIMNVISALKPITKEKILEIFENYAEPEDHHPTYDPVRRHNWDKVADKILNALTKSEDEGEWIHVEDRLPTDNREYLVKQNKVLFIARFEEDLGWSDGHPEWLEPSFWYEGPLPVLPKEGN